MSCFCPLLATARRWCHPGLFAEVRRYGQTKKSGGRVCNPGHPAPEIRSVGLVLLAAPSVLEASPALHSQPSPPGSGPALPAWGIGLPSPVGLCVAVSTEQAPSPDVLKVSSSRSLHDWRATRCPQVSTSLPRGLEDINQSLAWRDSCRMQQQRSASLRDKCADYTPPPHH